MKIIRADLESLCLQIAQTDADEKCAIRIGPVWIAPSQRKGVSGGVFLMSWGGEDGLLLDLPMIPFAAVLRALTVLADDAMPASLSAYAPAAND